MNRSNIWACAFTFLVGFLWLSAAEANRIAQLKSDLDQGDKSRVAKKFWEEIQSKGTPIIENESEVPGFVSVTFLFKCNPEINETWAGCFQSSESG